MSSLRRGKEGCLAVAEGQMLWACTLGTRSLYLSQRKGFRKTQEAQLDQRGDSNPERKHGICSAPNLGDSHCNAPKTSCHASLSGAGHAATGSTVNGPQQPEKKRKRPLLQRAGDGCPATKQALDSLVSSHRCPAPGLHQLALLTTMLVAVLARWCDTA